jgi:outer membrane protein
MKHIAAKPLAVFGLTLALSLTGMALTGLAQNALLNFDAAIKNALDKGPDIATSKANLENAQADLKSKESDPSTLVLQLTQARNSSELNTAQFNLKKLEVTQNVTSSYLSLYEAQENIKLLEAQLALDSRSLEIAKAKLAAKNGTQLDVSKAESTLSGSKQSLVDAKAQLPILSNRLEVILGTNSAGNIVVGAPPAFKERAINVTSLEANLEKRLPSVLQVAQLVTLSELNVQLADNDYTPPATLRDAKTNLENAKRNLVTAKSNAVTGLRDAHRSVLNSLERVRIAKVDLNNSEDGLNQDQAKFKSGTISRFQLQQSEVGTLRSRFSAAQANNNYLRALTSLSISSGVDVAGLVGGQ